MSSCNRRFSWSNKRLLLSDWIHQTFIPGGICCRQQLQSSWVPLLRGGGGGGAGDGGQEEKGEERGKTAGNGSCPTYKTSPSPPLLLLARPRRGHQDGAGGSLHALHPASCPRHLLPFCQESSKASCLQDIHQDDVQASFWREEGPRGVRRPRGDRSLLPHLPTHRPGLQGQVHVAPPDGQEGQKFQREDLLLPGTPSGLALLCLPHECVSYTWNISRNIIYFSSLCEFDWHRA